MSFCNNNIIDVASDRGAIYLGVWDTLNVRQQQFDVSAWIDAYGADGVLTVLNQRRTDELPYEVADVTLENGVATWTFDETDTAVVGEGKAALVYVRAGETIARTVPFATYTAPTIGMTGVTPPDPWESWYTRVLEASAAAQQAASSAAASASSASTAAAITNTQAQRADTARSQAVEARNEARAARDDAQAAQSLAETARDRRSSTRARQQARLKPPRPPQAARSSHKEKLRTRREPPRRHKAKLRPHRRRQRRRLLRQRRTSTTLSLPRASAPRRASAQHSARTQSRRRPRSSRRRRGVCQWTGRFGATAKTSLTRHL